MKYLMLVMDGVADRPVPALGGRTPLEMARTPNLDALARRGRLGLVRTIPAGSLPGTEIGSMSLFGLDPVKYYSGRGPIEAAQFNVPLGPEAVAFRCNLVTVTDDRLDDYAAGHPTVPEAVELIREIDRRIGSEGIRWYPGRTAGYRHLTVVNGHPAWAGARCAPPHDIISQPIEAWKPQGPGGRELWEVMLASREILQGHEINRRRIAQSAKPANMLWLWGPGRRPAFPAFQAQFGLTGAVITAVDLIKGLGRCLDLEIIEVPGATGYFDTNYRGKADAALKALQRHDFLFLHIEATDEAGHMGEAGLKVRAIEDVDRLVLGTLMKGWQALGPVRVAVVSDHATCCATRTHDAMPVPLLIYDSRAARERELAGRRYTEASAQIAGWTIDPGDRLLDVLLEQEPHRATSAATGASHGR